MASILRHYITPAISALLLAEAFLLISCYVISTYLVLSVAPEVYLINDLGFVNILITVLAVLLGMYFQETYNELHVRSRTLVLQQVCTAIGGAFLLQSFLNYVYPQTIIPRWLMLSGSILAIVGLTGLRIVYSKLVTSGMDARRILFLGSSASPSAPPNPPNSA
jgi:hypothetical protein